METRLKMIEMMMSDVSTNQSRGSAKVDAGTHEESNKDRIVVNTAEIQDRHIRKNNIIIFNVTNNALVKAAKT